MNAHFLVNEHGDPFFYSMYFKKTTLPMIYPNLKKFSLFSFEIFSFVLFTHQAGHLLTRNHGNPDAKDTPPQFPLIQQQCIDCERFKPLFECLTNWGTGEIGPILAQRAFKVSTEYSLLGIRRSCLLNMTYRFISQVHSIS